MKRRLIGGNNKVVLSVLLGTVLFSLSLLNGQKYHPSDPMLVDEDRLIDIPTVPEEIELSDIFDRFAHVFTELGDPNFSEAQNINSLDEVPDSSWFVNRHCRNRLSLEELVRGANMDGPPAPDSLWEIFRGKTQGITPGFSIEDKKGARFVIKFDPPDLPELATAAEGIASRLFYALGYYVPQNYIVYMKPENLRIKPETLVSDRYGEKVPLTQFVLDRMLVRVPRQPDGSIRVIASKYFDGVTGPFRYYGTRRDDPNDVIPHEHRRELRGLRLFAAWTNHDDTRAQNTQDTWVQDGDKHHIRHNLMDFGLTFGSGSTQIQLSYLAFNYSIPLQEMKRNAAGLGFRVPEHRRVKWPDFPEYKAVGRWEADHFDPLMWKNDYPNPAFTRMTARDAFWAGKIIMSFTEEELLAIVKTGEFSNPDHERYFHSVLVERQRRCGEAAINGINPLDGFQVVDDRLEFKNLSELHGFSEGESTSYQVFLHTFDNKAEKKVQTLLGPTMLKQTVLDLPIMDSILRDPNLLLLAEIHSLNERYPHWSQKLSVYLRSDGQNYSVVGIERDTPPEYISMEE